MLLMSMHEPDIRWQQRLSNFRKALAQLKKFIDKGDLNELEEQGLIQAFEYTYELGWNVLKDFLEYQGQTEIYGSRDTIRQAFQLGLIDDGEGWMEMYKSRTKTSHTYNEDTAREIATAVISSYYGQFVSLEGKMSELERSSRDLI